MTANDRTTKTTISPTIDAGMTMPVEEMRLPPPQHVGGGSNEAAQSKLHWLS
jgi:hypothetical protein